MASYLHFEINASIHCSRFQVSLQAYQHFPGSCALTMALFLAPATTPSFTRNRVKRKRLLLEGSYMTFNRVRLGVRYLALLILAACVSSITLNSQSTTQGSIAGTVLDSSEAVVPGATVNIVNAATGFTVNQVADSSGYFKAPLLEPGRYIVSISSPNFAKYRAEDVVVVVGQVTSLEPRLAVASAATEVVVTEQAPVMNLESPDFSDTLNAKAMQNIPINNRRWSALALTTPGVTVDTSGYGLVSIRGVSTILNNVEIDGADDNQAFFAEERGRTREAYSTAGSAVREFAVNTGVYSAEYGRAAGGVITSVTKSGTNQLHGQAYFYDRESNWNSFNDFAFLTTFANGTTTKAHIKPEDLRKIYGFTAGGALIKDKLFWIYTYDQHTHVFPALGVPYNPAQFYTVPSASLTGTEACNTTTGALTGTAAGGSNPLNDINVCALAARQGVSYTQASYDWSALLFGSSNVNVASYAGAAALSDLGLNSELGLVPRFGYQEINTPKLDWQVSPKHHVSVLFHRLRWDSPSGVQTTNPDMYAEDSQGNDFVKLDYGVAKLTSLITNTISNELLYQYGRELDYETQQPLTPYTKADISTSTNVPELEAGFNYGLNAGSEYYEHRVDYPLEKKWQVGDILYWAKGNHSFKFGVDAVHNYDLLNNTYKSNGDFNYNWVGNYFNDLLNMKNGITPSVAQPRGCDVNGSQNGGTVTGIYPCYASFTQGFGNPAYSLSTMDTGVFAQDNWKFTPRLTFELGLRWDHETIPPADPNLTVATANPLSPSGSFTPYNGITNSPSDWMNYGPRIGFSYDVYGEGKTVLRGGWGMYFGRITNGNIENVRLATGSPKGQITPSWSANTPGAPIYPNIISSGTPAACTATSSSCPTSYFMASNLKLPEVQEFDVQIQQALGNGTFLSVSYLGSLGRDLPNFLDVNLNPTTTTKTITVAGDPNGLGPLGANGATVTVPVYTSFGNTALLGPSAVNFSTVTEFISNVNSSYNALVGEILNRSLKSITFDANYTWSHSLDFAQNALTQGSAETWYDPYGNAHVNYGSSQWNIPNRFVAYALYNFPNLHGGSPLKWLVNDWSLDDSFQMQNGLPFTAGVSGRPSGSAVPTGSFWNGAGGPSIIPQIGYDTYRYPRRIVDDARLQKSVVFEGSKTIHSVDLILNAFNVANHQNITGFSATYLYSLSGTTATYTGVNGTGNKSFMVPNNSNSSNFTYSPRNVEIAAKINF
jgi:outer membrane receptor protein involved in Fe transport